LLETKKFMIELDHEIEIEASPNEVYEALVTQVGLRRWWTADSTAEPKEGSIATFGFGKRSTVFRMRLDELVPGKSVRWTCVGELPEWTNTRLAWSISTQDRATRLHLTHTDPKGTSGSCASRNSTWGELMYRLKAYVEGKNPGPHWLE
jgi:uncharacterized protein YndB with AHSA1/START domain